MYAGVLFTSTVTPDNVVGSFPLEMSGESPHFWSPDTLASPAPFTTMKVLATSGP